MRCPSTPVSFLDPRMRLKPLLGSELSLKSGKPSTTMRRIKLGAACSARQEDPRHCQEAHEAYGSEEAKESRGAITVELVLAPLQPPPAGTTICAPARTIDPVSCPCVQTKQACDTIERLLNLAVVDPLCSARKAPKARHPRGTSASAPRDSTIKLMTGVGTDEIAKKGAAEKTEADVCELLTGAGGGGAGGGQVTCVTATMYTFSTALLESLCVCVCACVCVDSCQCSTSFLCSPWWEVG